MTGRGGGGSARALDELVRDPFFSRAAVSLVADLPALVDDVARRVLSEVPFYENLSRPNVERVHADVEATLDHIIRGFANLEPLRFDRARSIVGRAAASGVPVAAVLHIFRLGAEVIWAHVAENETWRDGTFGVESVLQGAATLWAVVNAYSEVICEIYEDTAANRFRRFERERRLLLDTLFDGPAGDLPELTELVRTLDLPATGRFVVVVAENESSGISALAEPEQSLRLRDVRSAWRLKAQHHMGVVAVAAEGAGRAGPPPALDVVEDTIGSYATGRVGVSPVYSNLLETMGQVPHAELAMRSLPRTPRGLHSSIADRWPSWLPTPASSGEG